MQGFMGKEWRKKCRAFCCAAKARKTHQLPSYTGLQLRVRFFEIGLCL